MDATIICIGDELLIGQVTNTNATYISDKLTSCGIGVRQVLTIADSRQEITDALKYAEERSDIIICTGGLGPTKDDITRDALCTYFSCGLRTDATALQDITRIFEGRGLEVTELNRRQATIPDKSTALRNPAGTSPGMWFSLNSREFFFLPGVPFEMKQMLEEQVMPVLSGKNDGMHIVYKTVLTMGMGESFLSERIAGWENSLPEGITVAWLPDSGIIRLRITGKGHDRNNIIQLIQNQITGLEALIPELIFGFDDDTLPSVAGRLLSERKMTLSTAESCTGGRIASLITSVSGSSGYFTGSVVAYDNKVKTGFLGVNERDIEQYGAVSETVVIQMAEGARQVFYTDYAIATSGIAGPTGATEDKPVGTVWIAVAGPEGTTAQCFLLGNHRGRNINRASLIALNLLRKSILKIF